jgi:crotonobetainyl-CoA:carnitine CoA-transferase CaiB-like acyl-CoA transferase
VMLDLAAAGIAAGPVLRAEDLLDDPHVRYTGQLVDVSYPGMPRPAPIAEFPVALSGSPGRIRGPAPTLSADSESVLSDLGFSDARIAQWRDQGII